MKGEGRVCVGGGGGTRTNHSTQSLYSAMLLSHSPHQLSSRAHALFSHMLGSLAYRYTPHRAALHRAVPHRTVPHRTAHRTGIARAPRRTVPPRAARHQHRTHRLHSKSQAKGVVWSFVARSWSIKHICAVTPAHHLSVAETVEDWMPLERWGRCGGAGRQGRVYTCEEMCVGECMEI
jgi:hypothetical protein